MLTHGFILALVVLLCYGAYRRFRVIQPELKAMGKAARLRELAGWGFSLSVCALVILMYVLTHRPLIGFLSLAIVLAYGLTHSAQLSTPKR